MAELVHRVVVPMVLQLVPQSLKSRGQLICQESMARCDLDYRIVFRGVVGFRRLGTKLRARPRLCEHSILDHTISVEATLLVETAIRACLNPVG